MGDPSVSLVYSILVTSNGTQLVIASGNIEIPISATSGRTSTDQALTDAANWFASQNQAALTAIYVLPEWRLL